MPGVEAAIKDFLNKKGVVDTTEEVTSQLGVFKKTNQVSPTINQTNIESTDKSNITLVTGLWDLGRSNLTEGWSRTYDHYLDKFKQLLNVSENLIVFGDSDLRTFISNNTTKKNIQFIERSLSWFKENEYYQLVQDIRKKPEWFNQVGWLSDSTQAKLEMYNPLVMSKMFLLHDAKIFDTFNSDYMYWIDAGLSNTVHPGYFTHDKVLEKLTKYTSKFSFVCFPYDAENEIHGFNYAKLCEIAGDKVNKVARHHVQRLAPDHQRI